MSKLGTELRGKGVSSPCKDAVRIARESLKFLTDALSKDKPDFVVGQLVRSKLDPTILGRVMDVYQRIKDGIWMVCLGTPRESYHPATTLRHLNAEEVGPHWVESPDVYQTMTAYFEATAPEKVECWQYYSGRGKQLNK